MCLIYIYSHLFNYKVEGKLNNLSFQFSSRHYNGEVELIIRSRIGH